MKERAGSLQETVRQRARSGYEGGAKPGIGGLEAVSGAGKGSGAMRGRGCERKGTAARESPLLLRISGVPSRKWVKNPSRITETDRGGLRELGAGSKEC